MSNVKKNLLVSVYDHVVSMLNAGTNHSLLIDRWETTTKDSNTTTSQSSIEIR